MTSAIPPQDAKTGKQASCSALGLAARRDASIEFLMGRINYEQVSMLPYAQRHLKLDRMRQLLTRLGNPDAGMPIVHVAGTKGKGSTAALIAGILQAAGYQTGLFSSPHLERIEERFAINGQAMCPRQLAQLVEQLRPVVRAMDQLPPSQSDLSSGPTYFELTTALALIYFAQCQVDVAILEVGLGGRLDSTNVCLPVVTVITSISLDHTRQLGNSLAEIAAEKAGIIKPGVPLLCGQLASEPRQVIAAMARKQGCRQIVADEDFHSDYRLPRSMLSGDCLGRLDFSSELSGGSLRLRDVPLRLLGKHQADNAALALATACELRQQGWSIPIEAMKQGLAEVTLPARIEVIGYQASVVLDVAHNVASAQALVRTLSGTYAGDLEAKCEREANREWILVLAVSRDKDVRGMLDVLLPHFSVFIATQYHNNPRAMEASELASLARRQVLGRIAKAACSRAPGPSMPSKVLVEPQPVEAWKQARKMAQPDQLICVTGSFFIASELREVLLQASLSADSVSV
jgi:dihydrofolate synthase/folylpolyglutamate synthase